VGGLEDVGFGWRSCRGFGRWLWKGMGWGLGIRFNRRFGRRFWNGFGNGIHRKLHGMNQLQRKLLVRIDKQMKHIGTTTLLLFLSKSGQGCEREKKPKRAVLKCMMKTRVGITARA
jgi:hypothetical protein